jgi:ribonuclease P protein component
MGETDVPAEQPEAQEEARLSSPDAQSSGPRGDSAPAQQGPLQAFRLIWRVRGQASFRALARGRRRAAGDLEVRTVVLGSSDEPPRVAYAVGRSVGNAVTRNRVRRKLRAATASNVDVLQRGSGYLVRAQATAATTPTSELSSTLRAILASLTQENRGNLT